MERRHSWSTFFSSLRARRFLLGLTLLAILVGGFEAIHALHVGAERIGRYLQVYYEDTPDGPRWETTASRKSSKAT